MKTFTAFLFLFLPAIAFSQNISIRLDRNAVNQLTVAATKPNVVSDDTYDLQTSGTDPFIYSVALSEKYDPASVYYISFDYLAPQGLDDLQIYFGPPFSESKSLRIGKLPPSADYKNFRIDVQKYTGLWNIPYSKFRFDFGRGPNQKISVRNIKLTTPENSEVDFTAIEKNSRIVNYLNRSFTNTITGVTATGNKIIVKGNTHQQGLYLCELRMYDETKLQNGSFASVTPLDEKNSSFEIETKRFVTVGDTPYDKMYSRWIIASKNNNQYKTESFAHYADDISDAALQYLPEEKPNGKKGMAGFVAAGNTTPDLNDLQIKNVTVNIILPHLVSLAPTEYSFDLNGEKIYFKPEAITNLDRTIKTCGDNNIFVSAILIIPQNISQPLKSIFVHPDANGGVQSMANITSITGFNYYRGTLGFLAERYSKQNKEFGRIHNWIVHNEVDNGYYWANAGNAKMQYYTELYDRSMRTVYYTVRQYNPSAKVFLSLTHFWASTAKGIFYPPKDMLAFFNELSDRQGDYEWGIAYHPYPQNAFECKAWNDKDATDDINTTDYITPKNIELIDGWIRMKSHLYKGLKVRTLLFSEQGVHARSNKPEDLEVQAAGLAYMWKKCRRLPSLEAFDYHHAVDDLNEMGLMLGLWTVKPGTTGTPYERKKSWYVYQKAATPSEDSAFQFALPIIGVTNWKQVFNPLKTELMPLEVTFNVVRQGQPVDEAWVYFNGEVHKTINGKAKFYNVASLAQSRTYSVSKNNKLLAPAQTITVRNDQQITVDLSR
jgi:hypothetical protein